MNHQNNPLSIQEIEPDQFNIIRELSFQIWPSTFCEILSKEQIAYMLELMYSMPSLNAQYLKGHCFILARINNVPVGFAAYELNYKQTNKTKIHKIYIQTSLHGKGIGRNLLNYIKNVALTNKNTCITLNVNRFNKAILFYEKVGFKIVASEDIDIGNGFLMEDFVMDYDLY